MAHSSNGGKDDSLMKVNETQAMAVEKEQELDQKDRELQQHREELANARQEIKRLRQLNEQQRFDQANAAIGRKRGIFRMVHSSNGKKKKDDPLMKVHEAQAMVVEKMQELDQKNRELQQQRMELENSRQEIERLRQLNEQQRFDQAIAVIGRKFEEQLAEMGRQFETLTEENKIEAKRLLEREREDRAKVEEKVALVEKANEETKMMVKNMSIQLENVSSELEFHSSALILGGWHNEMTDSMCIFDSKENTWRTCKQKLPFKMGRHGSAILNGKIYFIGGYNLSIKEPLASCYKLGESGEWNKMADMNEKRYLISQSTIVFGSEIWVIGGWNESGPLKTVEKYNPQTNIWTKMPDLNFKRHMSSASIIGGKIFASGGCGGRKRLRPVEVYDPVKNKWEIFCDMPLNLHQHCSIAEGTNLILIGGEKSDETPSDEVWKIDVFDPKKEWIKMPSLKQGRYNHGAVKLSNGIMVFGGQIDLSLNLPLIDSVEIFDRISWKEGPKLPESCVFFSSIQLSVKTEKQLLLQLC